MSNRPRTRRLQDSSAANNSMSRRTFGQAIGAAAMGSSLQAGFFGEVSPTSAALAEPLAQGATGRDAELAYLSAIELASRIRRKQVSAREVMAAHLARIEAVNPRVNAIVTLVGERAMADAARADELLARGGPLGVLHGLPVAHKDLVDTAGIRTTRGSPFFRDHVPTTDALIVARIRAAGAVTLGKTNTPEFGAGSQTFNTVFGATRNPYDLGKTCGGSSGGAAVALACGMVPIADGSDTGGSLRNPAAFCNVVGFRPSPGRVPTRVGILVSRSRCPVQWRVRSRTSRCFSARLPDPIRGARSRFTRTARGFVRRSAGVSRACGSPGGADSAAFPSSLRSAVWSTRTAVCSRISAAWSKRPSRTSPASTRRFPLCATLPIYAQYAPLVAEKPEWVKDTIKFEVAQAERITGRGYRPRAGEAGADARAEPAVLRAVRLLHPAGHAGRRRST